MTVVWSRNAFVVLVYIAVILTLAGVVETIKWIFWGI